MMVRSHRWASIALLAAATATGCSDLADELPREAVSGIVTLDGQSLESGTIQFTPSESSTGVAGGASIRGGQFSIPRASGLVPGSYLVAIYSGSRGGDATKSSPEGRAKARSAKPSETIPAKYNSQTELKTEIKKGGSNDTLKFTLQSK